MVYTGVTSTFGSSSSSADKSALPEGLIVSRRKADWPALWDQLVRVSPRAFYDMLSKGVDGALTVIVNLHDSRQATIDLQIEQNKRIVFEATGDSGGNRLSHDLLGRHVRFEEWVVMDRLARGKGIGLNLFRNFVTYCQAADIDYIDLRAGKDDGKIFWARRGFYIKDHSYRGRMVCQIKENLGKVRDTLRPETIAFLDSLLKEEALDLNWALTHMPERHGGPAFARALMDGYNPEYKLDFRNPDQMSRVREALNRLIVTSPRSTFSPL